MAKIIESIPNISEGRNKEVIEACVDQIRNTPGCTLLDYSSDETHNTQRPTDNKHQHCRNDNRHTTL